MLYYTVKTIVFALPEYCDVYVCLCTDFIFCYIFILVLSHDFPVLHNSKHIEEGLLIVFCRLCMCVGSFLKCSGCYCSLFSLNSSQSGSLDMSAL